ncbi:zinc-binding alcohol dehydrogenase family protein [Brevibacterium moorei]|uniref:zinc-binding alcohol dehydrogenase family protein n=1 Tax=Brevibacterium moorei TaxID=2968457 RepID=UPI00211CC215|nr:zinc-binding alcohol dehydrogenase family protein [Brevibacterium sp. 68QC2CO]MCQ9386126.1 zinc-binding alcohol dehydrogenase family protein [Brevibacterium sp. 68QC2CO]
MSVVQSANPVTTPPEVPATMRAWTVTDPAPVLAADGSSPAPVPPLELREVPVPTPGPGELLIHVHTCGVCRTDLHVVEGDLAVHRPHVTPGHEVVGRVVACGPGTAGPGAADPGTTRIGRRVGVAWLRGTCGHCRWCTTGRENLCPESTYTGWDADGGYAEYTTVPAAYAYELPEVDDTALAPLLCAGIIGYHALLKAELPAGGRLGLYGFGGSAHLCAQLALAQGARVHVLTRDRAARELALELGAASAAGAYDMPPEPLDSAILFAPVGDIVKPAMRALDRGGVLSIAGIHLSDTPPLNYEDELFYEKQIRSVTSNTRDQGREFLELAARHQVRATTHEYPMSRALNALEDLQAGRFDGAAVLVNDL